MLKRGNKIGMSVFLFSQVTTKWLKPDVGSIYPPKLNIYVDALTSKFNSCSQKKKTKTAQHVEFQRPAVTSYATKPKQTRFLTGEASSFETQLLSKVGRV